MAQKTAGLTGEICEQDICQQEANFFALLVDSNQDVCARRPLCEIHAKELFGVNIENLMRRIEPNEQDRGGSCLPKGS